ncbi:MAG: helix-turn-helix domain-containing protein [Alphaproteobacteria bacterium]|nr:helix-turn-helix domain-containing protein [Alphaproteobacteria bacterium]
MSDVMLKPEGFGSLLKGWRQARGLSQMALAMAAGVSPRHMSFIETGRSRPSRGMVLALCERLALPLRDRNQLLEAAGHARAFGETSLSSPALAHMRTVVEFMLRQLEPYPAVAIDRHWNLVLSNAANLAVLSHFLSPELMTSGDPINVMRIVVDPAGLRPYIVNFPAVARDMHLRLSREIEEFGATPERQQLLEEVREQLGPLTPTAALSRDDRNPTISIHLQRDGLELKLTTMLALLGSPQDITLDELRLEVFVPADAATDAALRKVAEAAAMQS